ncbi:hypothetical protein BCR35DRAFT_109955 [Leucosporidium creatinivorum]|uniref:RRM domain-containing protein n=1 Tax=Leucosporidium creatinivorum TaxID=106004 RepID=A0A1Y2G4G5_9BASI|nr:hypothetical protein BCR35DRAFT_109955 [Leucosporidium creatinivorum]
MDPSVTPSGSNGMPPLAQPPPPAPTSDSGTQYSGSGRPIPRVSGAGAPLTGTYNPQKVYIGNLPETATLADLEDCFGQIGQCTCSIKRGFGFVEYLDAACAAEAVAKYHEGHFLGAQIKVELSHQRAPVARGDEGGRFPSRNPPGSDRPSDSRKPMHINGPPGQDRRKGGNPRFGGPGPGPYGGRPDQFAPQGGPGFANSRFGPPPPRDGPFPPRGGPFPPRGGDAPYGGPPGPDRYRDDYRAGPPPQRLTVLILATVVGVTSTLGTVLLLPRAILVGLLLPSGATATEVRLLLLAMLALPSTLTTMRLAVTTMRPTPLPVALPRMLLPLPFLAMLPLLRMATPVLPRFLLLATLTASTVMAKLLDLPPTLLPLMPLAVL